MERRLWLGEQLRYGERQEDRKRSRLHLVYRHLVLVLMSAGHICSRQAAQICGNRAGSKCASFRRHVLDRFLSVRRVFLGPATQKADVRCSINLNARANDRDRHRRRVRLRRLEG